MSNELDGLLTLFDGANVDATNTQSSATPNEHNQMSSDQPLFSPSTIPPHVLLEILLHDDVHSFRTFSLVCHHWCSVLRDYFQFFFYLRLERLHKAIDHPTLLQLSARADACMDMRMTEALHRHQTACDALGLAGSAAEAPLVCQQESKSSASACQQQQQRFGRWFALHSMLDNWRQHEPAVRELRAVMDHYAPKFATRLPELSDRRFRFSVEDTVRTELMMAVRRVTQSATLGASKLGGCADLPNQWLKEYGSNIPVLVAQINFSELPRVATLPAVGTLFVFADLDSMGHAIRPRARFWPHSLAEHNSTRVQPCRTPGTLTLTSSTSSVLSSSSSDQYLDCDVDECEPIALLPFVERVASFKLSVALPPPSHPRTPRHLAASTSYAFVRQWWLESRGLSARHALLGYAASWDADRLVQRQRTCDAATLMSRMGHKCGRDMFGLCGRRPLLTISSTPSLSFENGGQCVVWADSLRSRHDNSMRFAHLDEEADFDVTIE